jgi:hypothetical protein
MSLLARYMLRMVLCSLHCALGMAVVGMAVCHMHAACVLPHARYALHGRTAHLRRSAPPQGMLRDARRPGLWHACGAYSCIPNGAAHGGGQRAVAFGVRRAGVRRTFVFRHLVVVCFSFGAAMPCSSL